MYKFIIKIYRYIFARKIFFLFNVLVHRCGLVGLGVLNYENEKVSGEDYFLKWFLSDKNSPVVIDVGANIGNYSKHVLDLRPNSTIFAFEPHPKTFSRLFAELGKSNATLVNAAVGVEDGTLSLYDYHSEDGSEHASLYKGVIEVIHNAKSVEHVVPVIAIGRYLEEKGVREIDLLKIDTEGHELEVLKGMVDYIKYSKVKAIHFEFNEMNVVSRTFFKDFLDFLPGWDIYRLLPSGMLPINRYAPAQCEIFAYQNVVALRKIVL